MSTANISKEFRFSEFRLEVSQRKLFGIDDIEVTLSSRAFDALLVLVENRGKTLSKAFLMKVVWPTVIVEENNLNQAISSLRKALGDSKSESRFIQTVPGRGYCFVAELETIEQNPNSTQNSDSDNAQANDVSTANKADKSLDTLPISRLLNSRVTSLVLFLGVIVAGAFIYYTVNNDLSDATYVDNYTFGPLGSLKDRIVVNIIPDSIAVLPFTNLNPNADNELFSLGLHDEVINQLSKISSLNVISRDSVVALSHQQLPISELGRRLQVESVMTGTVLFVEEHARVNMQMLEPITGVTLWSTTYDADTTDLTNMISIQSDIALNVALALKAEINQQEKQAVEAIPTESFEAYRYNLAARNAYYTQDFPTTWTLTKQALELDPNYLNAHYNFSYVNTVLTALPLPGMTSHQHYQLALESAEKIIEIAPDRSEGYALKASALSTNKEWDLMALEIARLRGMNVSLADMKFYALILLCMGDFDGAIEIFEANLMIEPVNLYGRGFLLSAYELTGNRTRSREEYQVGEELNPIWWGDTVNVLLTLGRNEPLKDVDELFGISDNLRYMLSNLQNRNEVSANLQEYLVNDYKVSAETVNYSAVAAYIGEPELAIELMRLALDDVWLSFHWLWLPVFDEARKLESFRELLRDSGIVNYWEQHGWPEVCQPEGDTFSCDWVAYP